MVISCSLRFAKMFSIWHGPAIMISQRKERERELPVWDGQSSERAIISQNSNANRPSPPLPITHTYSLPSLLLTGTNNSTVAEALKKQSAEYPRVMSVAG